MRSSAATFAERKLVVGHFAKVISSAARVAERGLTLDGRCLKVRPLMVRGGVRPPRNGANPNLAMGRGSRKNNNPYPKASRISVATPVS